MFESTISNQNPCIDIMTPNNTLIQQTISNISVRQEKQIVMCSPLSAAKAKPQESVLCPPILENEEKDEEEEDLETIQWPLSVVQSNVRAKGSKKHETERELREFEKIEKSITDSSCVFELDTSKKTKKDDSSLMDKSKQSNHSKQHDLQPLPKGASFNTQSIDEITQLLNLNQVLLAHTKINSKNMA